jgi:hypothetical protein
MQDRTRSRIFIFSGLILVVFIAAWWYYGFSLEFMKFFAAEPTLTPTPVQGATKPSPTPTRTLQPGGIVSCMPETQNARIGDSVVLTATSGSGVYAWYAPEGTPNIGNSQSFTVRYATAGIKKVIVESARSGSGQQEDNRNTIVDSVACTIVVRQDQ